MFRSLLARAKTFTWFLWVAGVIMLLLLDVRLGVLCLAAAAWVELRLSDTLHKDNEKQLEYLAVAQRYRSLLRVELLVDKIMRHEVFRRHHVRLSSLEPSSPPFEQWAAVVAGEVIEHSAQSQWKHSRRGQAICVESDARGDTRLYVGERTV